MKKTKETAAEKFDKKQRAVQKKYDNLQWIVSMFFVSFTISVVMSYLSAATLKNVSYFIAFIILIIFIIVGIAFDTVGLAVASCGEKRFHSMGARKIFGAKASVRLIRNAERVSSFCNDVVGDIAGIVSGATAAAISARLVNDFSLSEVIISLVITGLVASLTISGKAVGKVLALRYNGEIVFFVGKIIAIFSKE